MTLWDCALLSDLSDSEQALTCHSAPLTNDSAGYSILSVLC